MGVHLSIDDFGTGFCNFAMLRKMPAEELKIDRSFVLDLETSADARAVVDAVVKLGQALGRKVVAEGVETEGQAQVLRALGCDDATELPVRQSRCRRARWPVGDERCRTP